MNELDVLKRNAGISEAVDQALIDQVVDQIMRDIEMGDQTAIEELLMSCPEDKLRGFLSEVEESKNVNEDSKTMKVKVINSGYGTDMGMKDAEIISQELDSNMKPILKVRIKDFNLGDPVIAEWRNDMWTVDMD
tara:strand:- start:1351 stop:1752 length:402 start_codon:yes stop_codon:yes gene_type:complete